MQDKVKYIAEEYGIYRQLIKLVEEMSEVTKEIAKLLNSKRFKPCLRPGDIFDRVRTTNRRVATIQSHKRG